MNDVMVDLETLGNGPNAAIIAIGAVKFDAATGLGEEFYKIVDLESSVQSGGVIDAATVLWWMGQSDAARQALLRPGEPLATVLLAFSDWLGSDRCKIWGNGASFDNVIVASAYRRLYLPMPWKFWNDRCYRTVKAMNPHIPFVGVQGTAHNALDDAKSQAQHLIEMLRSK